MELITLAVLFIGILVFVGISLFFYFQDVKATKPDDKE